MSIFIFEDDVLQAQRMKEMIHEICLKLQLSYDFIEVTSRSENIIKNIQKATYIPIYFLDIEIKNEKHRGLELAKEIRKYDQDGLIVFVTTHSELAPISYQYMVSALTFIDKALPYTKRYEAVEQCLLHYRMRNAEHLPKDDFIIQNAHTTIKVPFEKVEYIQTAEAHRLELITTDQLIHFYGTLKEIERLDDRLFRCHQSYIVNTAQISAYDSTDRMITLNSNKRIPVSRRLNRKIQQLLRNET